MFSLDLPGCSSGHLVPGGQQAPIHSLVKPAAAGLLSCNPLPQMAHEPVVVHTSMVKSTWPGVSIMLMTVSCHWQYVAADWIVIPFSRSRSIESIFAPTPSLPRTWQAATQLSRATVHAAAHQQQTHMQGTDLMDSMYPAGIEEDALRERGFARVNMRGDANVANLSQLRERVLLQCWQRAERPATQHRSYRRCVRLQGRHALSACSKYSKQKYTP